MGNILTNYQGKECEDVQYIVSGNESHGQCLLRKRDLEHFDKEFHEYSDSLIEPLQNQANVSVTHTTEFPHFSNTCVTEFLSKDTHSPKHQSFDNKGLKMEFPVYMENITNRSNTHCVEERIQMIPRNFDTHVLESIRDKIILCGEMEHTSERWAELSQETGKYLNFSLPHDSVSCSNHKKEIIFSHRKFENWNKFKCIEKCQQNGKTNTAQSVTDLVVKNDYIKHAVLDINILKDYFGDDIQSQFTKLLDFLFLNSTINLEPDQKDDNCNLKKCVGNLISEMYRIENFKFIARIFLIYLSQLFNKELNQSIFRKLYFKNKDSKTMSYISNVYNIDEYVCNLLEQGFLGKLVAFLSSFSMTSFVEYHKFAIILEIADAISNKANNNNNTNNNTPYQLIAGDKDYKLQKSSMESPNIAKPNGTYFHNSSATPSFIFNGRNKHNVKINKRMHLRQCIGSGMEVQFRGLINNMYPSPYISSEVQHEGTNFNFLNENYNYTLPLKKSYTSSVTYTFEGTIESISKISAFASFIYSGKRQNAFFLNDKVEINGKKVPKEFDLGCILNEGMEVILHFKHLIKNIQHNSYMPFCVRVLSEDSSGFSDIKNSAVCLYRNTEEELNLKASVEDAPAILNFVASSWGKAVYNSTGKEVTVLFYKENAYVNDTKVPDNISLDSVLYVGMPVVLSFKPDSLNVTTKLFWYVGCVTELNDFTGSVLFFDGNIQERASILSHEVYIDKMKCETSKLNKFLFIGMQILIILQPLETKNTNYRVAYILRHGGNGYPMLSILNLKTFSRPLDVECQKAQGQVSIQQSYFPHYSEIISSLKTALVSGGLMWRECLQNKMFTNIENCMGRARFADSPGIILDNGILRVWVWGKPVDVLFNTKDVYINGERCLNPQVGAEFHCTASILPSSGQRGETHFAWCLWQGLRPEVQHVFNSFSGLCPEELLLEEQTFYKGLVVAVYPPNAALATISVGRTSVPVVIYVNILTEKKPKQGFPTGPWIIDYINVGDYLNVTVRRAQKSNKSLNKLGFKWIAISASKIDLRGITPKTVLKNLYEGSVEESKTITGTILAVYSSFGLITYTIEGKMDIGIFIKNQLLIDGRKFGPTEQLKNTLKNGISVSFIVKLANFINKEIHLISFSIKSVKNYEICAISNLKCLCQLKNYIPSMDSTLLNKYCGKITDIMDDAAILSCGEKRILFYKNNLFISGFKREKISILSEVIQNGMVFYCNTISLDDNFVHCMNATHYSYHVWDGVLPSIEYTFDAYFTSQAIDVPPINTELCGVVSDIVSPHLGMVIVEYNSCNIPVLLHITNFSLEKGGKKLTTDHWIQEYISIGDTVFMLIKNCKRFRFLIAKEFWKYALITNNSERESYEECDQTYKSCFTAGMVVKKFQEIYDKNPEELQQKEESLLNHNIWEMTGYSENEGTLPPRFRSIEGVVSERNVATVCIGNLSFNVYYTDNLIFINGKRGSDINVGDCIHCTATKQFVPELKKDAYVACCVWQGVRPDVDKVFESFYNDSLSAIVLAENEQFAGTVLAIYPPDAAIVSVSLGCLHIPIILYVQALKYKKSSENWINDFISIGDRIYLYVKRSSRSLNRLGFKWVASSAYKIEDRVIKKIADEKKFPSQIYSGIITALYEQFGLISFQIKNEQKVAMFFKENILINGENILPSIALKDIYETGFPVCFNVDSDPNQKKLLYMANNVMTKYLSFCKKCGLQCSCSISDVDIDFMLKNSEFCGKIEKLDNKVGYVTFKLNGRNELAFFFKSKTIYNGVRVKHQSEPSVLSIGSAVVMKLRRVDDESKYNAKFIADYVEVKDLPSICNNDNLCSYPVKEQILKSITSKVKYYKTLKCGVLGFSYNKKYYEIPFTDDVVVYPQDSQNISLPEMWPIGKQLYIDVKLNHNLSDILITSVWDSKKGKETVSIHDSILQNTLYKAIIKDVKNPKGFVATINHYGSNIPVLVPHSVLNCCEKYCKGSSIHVIVEKQLEPEKNILWKAVKAWNKNESHSISNASECAPYIRKGTLMKLTKDYGLLQTEDGLIVFESHWTYLYGICLDDIHLTDLFQPGDILNYSLGMNKSKRNVKVWFGSDIAEDFSTIYNDLITYCSLKQVSSAIINVLMMRLGVMRKMYPNIDTDIRSERLAPEDTKRIINKDNKQSKNLKRFGLFLTSSSSSESFDEIQSCENIPKPISVANTSNSLTPIRSQSEKCVKIKNDIQSEISTHTFTEKQLISPEVTKTEKQVKHIKSTNYKENNSFKEKFNYLKQGKVENNQADILQANKVAVSNKNAQYSNLKAFSKYNFQILSKEVKALIEGSLNATLSDEGFDHDCLRNTTCKLLNTLESEARKSIIKIAMKALPTACDPNLQEETTRNIYEKWKHKFEYEIEKSLTIKAYENGYQFNTHQHDGYLCKNKRTEVKMSDKGTQTISTGNVLYLKLYPNI